jgi:hypothetical protein
MMVSLMSNRLATIATRQRSTRLRDAMFAAFIALAAAIAVTSVGTAVDAASTHLVQR